MSKTKKRILASVLTIILLIGFIVSATFLGIYVSRKNKINQNNFSSLIGTTNRTVLFIGDGMGQNHINVTKSYYEKDLFLTSNAFSYKGEITTFSNSLVSPTDSAAAGSALATGKKYNNKEVARHNGKNIESISEYAKSIGLGVGVVTTDSLSGATPACFSSHANNRGDDEDIILGQSTSNIDLFLGAGYNQYNNYKDKFLNTGYSFYNDYSKLNILDNKIIASFESVISSNGTNLNPTLDMLTSFAIDFMEQHYENGYFLMIEGAHIDKMSHKNDIYNMVKYLNNFDESIKLAHEKLSTKNNVSILITADHETGGLKFNNQTKDKINNSLFTRSGHSSKNVPYFIYLKTEKIIDINNVFKKVMDNTDIFKIMKAMLTKQN